MSRGHSDIAECVRKAIERYFRDLDGEDTVDLYNMVMQQVEAPMLEAVMRHAEGNQTRAAEMLGINRNTLRRKLDEYGLL